VLLDDTRERFEVEVLRRLVECLCYLGFGLETLACCGQRLCPPGKLSSTSVYPLRNDLIRRTLSGCVLLGGTADVLAVLLDGG